MTDTHWQALDPRVTLLWRVQGVVRTLVGLAPLVVGMVVGLTFVFSLQQALMAGGGLLALALLQAVTWPSFSWRAFRYAVRDDALLVQQGVLFQHTVAIPRHRIQHADLRQGPIDRAWGLTTLVVFTAAGAGLDASIPGLDEDVAEALRDLLLKHTRPGEGGV